MSTGALVLVQEGRPEGVGSGDPPARGVLSSWVLHAEGVSRALFEAAAAYRDDERDDPHDDEQPHGQILRRVLGRDGRRQRQVRRWRRRRWSEEVPILPTQGAAMSASKAREGRAGARPVTSPIRSKRATRRADAAEGGGLDESSTSRAPQGFRRVGSSSAASFVSHRGHAG